MQACEACEARVRIKPGASAPGSSNLRSQKPAEQATQIGDQMYRSSCLIPFALKNARNSSRNETFL
jgi:hypothetical protein